MPILCGIFPSAVGTFSNQAITVTSNAATSPSTFNVTGTGTALTATTTVANETVLLSDAQVLSNVVSLTPPFTVAGWVRVTGGTGYILSLSGYYYYGGNNEPAHSGLVSINGKLNWAWYYMLAAHSSSFVSPQFIQNTPADWFYLTAEVDSAYLMKVAINGQFVCSKQLSSSSYVPSNGSYKPQAGGINSVGFGDPNGSYYFTIGGTLQNLNVWNSLVWNGQSFTPPARF